MTRRWDRIRLARAIRGYFSGIVIDGANNGSGVTLRQWHPFLGHLWRRHVVTLEPTIWHERPVFGRGALLRVTPQAGSWVLANEQAQSAWRICERREAVVRLGWPITPLG